MEERAISLETPITAEEIGRILKESAPGKSPGPERLYDVLSKKN